MKLSMMTNDQAAEAIIRISEPMSNLCDDEELVSMLGDFSKMENMGIVRAVGKLLPRLTAYALKKHKKDVYEIIGALHSVPTETVPNMNFVETLKIVQESYDDVLKDFFTHSEIAESRKESAS